MKKLVIIIFLSTALFGCRAVKLNKTSLQESYSRDSSISTVTTNQITRSIDTLISVPADSLETIIKLKDEPVSQEIYTPAGLKLSVKYQPADGTLVVAAKAPAKDVAVKIQESISQEIRQDAKIQESYEHSATAKIKESFSSYGWIWLIAIVIIIFLALPLLRN